ncbi:hypothetical protein PoB_001228700 [Plakobranchus ocellatus]|uniref:Uncharacterized protein n=1 Tax=Plakobranchus ocellatus TaxID=259542 RepID=A0AAV3YTH8_9GAST|nr:hypothetical protein PoB_001228700 [Plakobranchus ocellatus]
MISGSQTLQRSQGIGDGFELSLSADPKAGSLDIAPLTRLPYSEFVWGNQEYESRFVRSSKHYGVVCLSSPNRLSYQIDAEWL